MKWFLIVGVICRFCSPVAIIPYDTEAECQEARPVPAWRGATTHEGGWVQAACVKQEILRPIILGPGPD